MCVFLTYICVRVRQVVLISDEPGGRFEDIVGVSDAYVPAAGLWVGGYPYVNKVCASH